MADDGRPDRREENVNGIKNSSQTQSNDKPASHYLDCIMPGAISILFHVALAVIFLLAASLLVSHSKEPPKILIDIGDTSINIPDVDVFNKLPELEKNGSEGSLQKNRLIDEDNSVEKLDGNDSDEVTIPKLGGGRKGELEHNDKSGSGGGKGLVIVEAHHVIYVIDASGSMLGGTLDEVKRRMLSDIRELNSSQKFHVIFFNDGLKDEFDPKNLVYATRDNKNAVNMFTLSVRPKSIQGLTDPRPALAKAFKVMANVKVKPGRPGKMIVLLTDGVFDVPREQLLKDIRRMNTQDDVVIKTILCGYSSPDPTDPNSAESVCKAIAEEANGKFKLIELD